MPTALPGTATAIPSRCYPLVGAIRWDAWVGDLSPVGLAVETRLAPKHRHYRLPLYGIEVSDTKVQVRANSQAVMDREIAYASAAGLDYWAFVIYPEDNPMSLGLKLHLSSQRKSDIHFCLILQGGFLGGPGIWADHFARYVGYFRDPMYQTVLEGRPLVYLYVAYQMMASRSFGSAQAARKAIDELREAALAPGVGNPYLVIQDWSYGRAWDLLKDLGGDAVGAYASGGRGKSGTYKDLAADTQRWWDDFRNTGAQVVPLVSAGWDPRPRIEARDPGFHSGNSYYYEPPTPQELAGHLQAALKWIKTHPEATESNAVLIYAWNKTDEGGWLAPTLKEGAARLDAIKIVLEQR